MWKKKNFFAWSSILLLVGSLSDAFSPSLKVNHNNKKILLANKRVPVDVTTSTSTFSLTTLTKFSSASVSPSLLTTKLPSTMSDDNNNNEDVLVGDDSAYFSLEDQNLREWIIFTVATAFVLVADSFLWFLPGGPHWGDVFLESTQAIVGTDPAITVFAMLAFFAVVHSGLASLRPLAEEIVGARAWRVVFAVASLPLALSCISYFINHAHEGIQLWNVTGNETLHSLLFVINFISFIFLYPSTFNLLEIAAVQKPQLHLWETGIIRITRHPQAVGQVMWCLGHTLWLGTSTAIAASAMLILHHGFSTWNGDRRLRDRHGEAFDYVKERTSIIPFQAILEGRQQLPPDYYQEFLRGPYLLIVGGTTAAYFAHPFMMAGAALLGW